MSAAPSPPPSTVTSPHLSPLLTLPNLLLLLSHPSAPAPTTPLLATLIHLLSSTPPPHPAGAPTLHQARVALARLLVKEGRLVEAEAEWSGMERAARSGSQDGKGEGEGVGGNEHEREQEWRESVMGLVGCLEGLGRAGRARGWRRKLEEADAQKKGGEEKKEGQAESTEEPTADETGA